MSKGKRQKQTLLQCHLNDLARHGYAPDDIAGPFTDKPRTKGVYIVRRVNGAGPYFSYFTGRRWMSGTWLASTPDVALGSTSSVAVETLCYWGLTEAAATKHTNRRKAAIKKANQRKAT